uniref:CARMIL C-terminal domain-containing protein n=1 Tax=Scophthalmus maximus TaxID=52904 RepID=A0A8D3CE22_SCOMX
MLSKALQINTTLRSVTWDRNSTSASGFLDVARALEHNFTLQYMPLPLSDISQAHRSAPERTEQALTKIQRALVRNNQTQRFSQRQALRLHQGLVTSTAEQVALVCVRSPLRTCRGAGGDSRLWYFPFAVALNLNESSALWCSQLYPSLCELAHVLSVDGPVRQRLDSLAGELAKAADKELQVIVDSMVSLCRELCPLSSAAAERLSPPLSSVSERVSIPRSAIRTALMERAAQDIHRALEEVRLSVVSYLTNSIVDQILQELYATHKTLTRQVSHLKRWDGSSEDGTSWRFNRHRDSLDITDEELGNSIDTIAIKKRSSRTRRIRPVSTRLSLCDDSSSSPPPSSVPSYSLPLSRSASWEGLSELPTQGLPLHHVTRVRPRPPRRHKGGHDCSENGGISPLDDGLPDFYTKRVLPDSQLSSLHKAHSLRRKKRRNMLAIFGFRKNRNQTLSSQGPQESEADIYGDGCHTVSTAPTGTATENVYTLLQPPRSSARAGSPGEGADGKMNDHQGKNTLVLSPPTVPGIPHPGVGGSKHPFYSPREVQSKAEGDAVFDPPVETDRYWVEDKHRATEGVQVEKQWSEARQSDQHVERQRADDRLQERTFVDPRTADRPTDRYWTESRHPDRHVDRQWTVDRHTQRQIDRKIERQWMGGRQIERSWSENRPTDIQVDNPWTESRQQSRKMDRQVQALHLAQRPLPPYPSDRTPSPKQETDPLKSTEAAATDRHQQDTQGDRHACADVGGGFADGWRGGTGGGRAAPPASKPDPPPQSSKPNLSKLRQRHRLESSDALPALPGAVSDEGLRPQAPVKPQRNRKAMSCDAGTDRESPNNVEKPPNRKPPVKKPRLPQNRNKSLDLSDSIDSAPGHSELL